MSQSQQNAVPFATASSSPVSYAFNNIGTATATNIVSANQNRSGLLFHNPGATASIYVYPTNITAAVPTSTTVGGSFVVYPGSTLSLPAPLFANVNGTWAAFAGTGTNQPFTVVEFL